MIRHSLPLIATFEVAARHQSFARAAEELNITPSAISQQIRLLEDRLGTTLFIRNPRSLTLTPSGQDYAQKIRQGLTSIQTATQALSIPRAEGILRIATFHSFGLFWLLPRLPLFRNDHPGIDIRLVLGNTPVSLPEDEADIAIRFGNFSNQGCLSQDLTRDSSIIVASPALLAGHPPCQTLPELRKYPFLHDESVAEDEQNLRWSSWLPYSLQPDQNHLLPDGLSVIHACLLGQGIALVRASLVSTLLDSGQLVRLFSDQKELNLPYRLVTRPNENRPRITAFTDWLTRTLRNP